MRRYALWIAYEGTKYAGWQVQPHTPTIAGSVEAALNRLTGHPGRLVGAGRTDAGVHARQQIAHWEQPDALPMPFLPRLNALLPKDIQALALYATEPSFHARHNAISRTYRYYIRFHPDPFRRAYSLWVPPTTDVSVLLEAASWLVGDYDFSAFGKEVHRYPHTRCEVYRAEWHTEQPGYYFFEIEANRFLRAMVRALTGAQLRLAQGKLDRAAFWAALHHQDRRWGMHLAPPQGLFLWAIRYPDSCLSLLESYGVLSASLPPGAAAAPAPESLPDPAGAPFRGAQ